MIRIERRLDMDLTDHKLMAQLMKINGYTVRSLADDVNVELRKKKAGYTIKHATIGHLRSGFRSYCKPETAEVVAQLLRIPTTTLFLAKVSDVQRETQRTPAA